MSIDLEIARAATLRPIAQIAEKAGIPLDALEPYGKYKAKIGLDFVASVRHDRPLGKLVLVTGINPTPAGEGKTTTSVALAMGLAKRGRRAVAALRESLGPDAIILINMSGRGDKDVETAARWFGLLDGAGPGAS